MPNRTAIVAFFNTALGLWLLSTVAVGIVSTGYSLLTAHLEESAKKKTQVERVHLEVLQRFIQLSAHLENITSAPGFNENLPDERVSSAVVSFIAPPTVAKQTKFPIYAAFDEYKERPFISLCVEIIHLVGQAKSSELDLEGLLKLNEEKLKQMPAVEVIRTIEISRSSKYWVDWEVKF